MTQDSLISLCKKIEDDCMWNAETHHKIANDAESLSFKLQVIPAILASIFAVMVSHQLWLEYTVWLTLVSGIVTAISSVANPKENYYRHLVAAKSFTVLKQKAYALSSTFSEELDQDALSTEVKRLHDAYCIIVQNVPPTNNKAFDKASERIKSRVHEPEDHS